MVGTHFFRLVSKAFRTTTTSAASRKKAMEWYRNAALKAKDLKPGALKDYYTSRKGIKRIRPISRFDDSMIGRLMVFQYSAFHKDKLPYWDAVPVVLPIKMIPKAMSGPGKNGAGFMGLNLHYLPPNLRARFLDAIYAHYGMGHLNETRRLKLDYALLNSTARLKLFKPCIKHYLFRAVKSRFNVIHPDEWDFVVMLPMADWQKASQSKVWQDSRRKLRS